MEKGKTKATVRFQEKLAEGIYSMWIETELAAYGKPGQFLSLYSKDGARLLPRPISLCEVEEGAFRIVYRVVGEGTREFSGYQAGDPIWIMGPLGNGFPIKDKKALLIGGGIGIPPMVELAKRLPGEVTVVAGYRDELFLTEELSRYGSLYISTEDGSRGTKGNVLDAIKEQNLEGDVIYACGPTPMLRGVKEYGAEKNIETWLSLEERMGCGIGACLACVCQSKEVDSHSHVHNKRICKDGPVFLAGEVEI